MLQRLRGNSVLIEEQFAEAHNLHVFAAYRWRHRPAGRARLRSTGIYRDPQLLQGSIFPPASSPSLRGERSLADLHRSAGRAVAAPAQRRGRGRALPRGRSGFAGEYIESIRKTFDKFIYLLYALLAMSVVISLFGIANSLFLSIHERTREFGLLRAVGAPQRRCGRSFATRA